jgi:hypothetical protein
MATLNLTTGLLGLALAALILIPARAAGQAAESADRDVRGGCGSARERIDRRAAVAAGVVTSRMANEQCRRVASLLQGRSPRCR